MEIYFDLSFFESLLYEQIDDAIFADFFLFTKTINDCHCYIFTDTTPGKVALKNVFLGSLFINGNRKLLFLPKSELESVLKNTNSSGFKFFFLNDEVLVSDIRSNYGYWATSTSSFNSNWHKVLSGRQDLRQWADTDVTESSFSEWVNLRHLLENPINSIVLSDRYLIDFDKNDHEINIKELLKLLGLRKLDKLKIDVCVVCESLLSKNSFGHVKVSNSENITNFNKSFKWIESTLNELIGDGNYNLIYVELSKDVVPKPKEFHFRILYTNVLFLNPGSSFDFFVQNNSSKSTGPKKNCFSDSSIKTIPKQNEFLNIDFILWKRSRHRGPLDLIAEAIDKLADIPPIKNDKGKVTDPGIKRIKVKGEKTCRLLNNPYVPSGFNT